MASITFNQFKKLPAELRIKIWKQSMYQRVVKISYDLGSKFYSTTRIPGALQACKESREVYQRYYKLAFGGLGRLGTTYVNFEIDIIFLSYHIAFAVASFFVSLESTERAELRHLALDERSVGLYALPGFGAPHNMLTEDIEELENLETLYTVEKFQDLLAESDRQRCLKRITSVQTTESTYFRQTISDFVLKRWGFKLLTEPQSVTASSITMKSWEIKNNAILVEWPARVQALSEPLGRKRTSSNKTQTKDDTSFSINLAELLQDHESLI